MQVAFVLYPGFTALDMVGPFEVLAFVPGVETVIVAEEPGPVVSEMANLVIGAAAGLDDVPRPDIVVVPGGPGQAHRMVDGALHEWLRTVDRTCAWMTSVCTGSLILAAAGLLAGRRATSHWLAVDQLPRYGVTPADERVVVDGHYVTAAGVSAGIDMALALTGRIAGDDVARSRQLSIEYAPEPPYDAGSPRTAPPAVVASLVGRRDEILTGWGCAARSSSPARRWSTPTLAARWRRSDVVIPSARPGPPTASGRRCRRRGRGSSGSSRRRLRSRRGG